MAGSRPPNGTHRSENLCPPSAALLDGEKNLTAKSPVKNQERELIE
jgi:hypothetical protein